MKILSFFIFHLRVFFIYLESELQLHVGHIVILTL